MSILAMKWLLIAAIFATIYPSNVAAESSEMMAILETVNGTSSSIASVLPQMAKSIQNQEVTQNKTVKILSQLVIAQAEMAKTLNEVIIMIQGVNECFSRPCQNQGKCMNIENGYRCECQAGWTGDYCEIDFNECGSDPCLHGGRCVDGLNSHTCHCLDGWTGTNCDTNIDECSSIVCLHGGECIDDVNAFACQCLPGWTGQFCEINIDECSNVLCQNGGVCEDRVNGYTCRCLAGWAGDLCEKNRTCGPDDFHCEDGKCISIDSLCDGFNNCAKGTDEDITTCATCPYKFLCSNGKCVDTVNVCDGMDHCQDNSDEDQICVDVQPPTVIQVNETFHQLLWNHAPPELKGGLNRNITEYAVIITSEDESRSEVMFLPAEEDAVCDIPWLEARTKYTVQIDVTIHTEGQGEQTYDIGIPFITINTEIDECSSDPCLNGGQCIDGDRSYTCQCVDGCTGNRCEIRPICKSDSFVCDGRCIPNKWVCDGFPDCANSTDEDEDLCASCPNKFLCTNGRCIDIENVCDGNNHCHDNSDEDQLCFDIPAPHVIYSSRTSFTLQGNVPLPTLTGNIPRNITQYNVTITSKDDGDSRIMLIPSEPGRNDFICEVTNLLPNSTHHIVVTLVISTDSQGEQTYDIGIPEMSVTTEIDECSSSPCQNNGQCFNGFNTFICVCPAGWTGSVCEMDIDECSSSPCLNRGRCTDGLNGYRCQCLDGWTGVHCERNIDDCLSNPCRNEGVCIDGDNHFTCRCVNKYSGNMCEINPTCQPTEFLCPDGSCIPSDWVCDRFPDCVNGTDEDERTCAMCPYQFLCTNGKCVDLENVCDGTNNCRDNSDEDQICIDMQYPTVIDVGTTSFSLQWHESFPELTGDLQRNITRYVVKTSRLNEVEPQVVFVTPKRDAVTTVTGLNHTTTYNIGIYIVVDTEGQGEQTYDVGIHLEIITNNTDECASSPCLNGGECTDGDEQFTCRCVDGYSGDLCEINPTCQPDHFLCHDGKCIPHEWVCDMFPDCVNGTDEDEVTCSTCPFKFLCSNGRCVMEDELCDGVNNCLDNSDEEDICIESPLPSAEGVSRTSITVEWNAFPTVQLSSKPQRSVTEYVIIARPRGGGESHTVYVPVDEKSHFVGLRGDVTIRDLQLDTTYDVEILVIIDNEGQGRQTFDIGIPRVSARTHIFACASDPCQNGGVCVDGVRNFTCQCVRKYTGPLCEIKPVCDSNHFLCYDGSCISSAYVCDRINDCDSGTDEDRETCATCPFKFFCSNGRCVDKDNVCDGTNNCQDNSDEDLICFDSPSPSLTVNETELTVTVEWSTFPNITGIRRREITYLVVTTTTQYNGESEDYLFPIEDNVGIIEIYPGRTTVTYGIILDTEEQGEQRFGTRIASQNINTACDDDLGMEYYDIPNGNIQSSSYSSSYRPYYGRLHYDRYWRASSSDSEPWIQADIGYQTIVTGVATQGSYYYYSYDNYWVTSFKISTFSMSTSSPEIFIQDIDGSDKVFPGNNNRDTVKTTLFPELVFARIVRITCLSSNGAYAMRFEILGCRQEGFISY